MEMDVSAPGIKVYRNQKLFHMSVLTDSLEIGRQRPGEQPPPYFDKANNRLIAAALDEKLVSREHVRIKRIAGDAQAAEQASNSDTLASEHIQVTNLSKKRSVWVEGHGRLAPQESIVRNPPTLVSFEDFAVRIEQAGASGEFEFRSLGHQTLAPTIAGKSVSAKPRLQTSLSQIAQNSLAGTDSDSGLSTEQLIHWLGQTMEVLQSAAGAADYLVQAVEAVHRIVGMDAIAALRYDGNDWDVKVCLDNKQQIVSSQTIVPSRTVLQQVVDLKRTIRRLPSEALPTQSLQGVSALVVSPILDTHGAVIGALYAVRNHKATQLPQISELEATMVEVIACSAAAGIAREVQQERAIAARVQFEQFFTPQLAAELETNPQLLVGQDADISVLFCDIVSFSSISGRVGSRMTMDWIGDVMDRLSDAILKHEGVLVDYIGDELMAMWGAPKAQLDHAQLACLAANDLLACREEIDREWLSRIGVPTDVRIGIASGGASVGNTGSRRKFKYGPLGETVNLASRLQGAGKKFGVHTLVNGETALSSQDNAELLFRPLGRVRLVNMIRSVSVYESLYPAAKADRDLCDCYREIMIHLNAGNQSAIREAVLEAYRAYPNDLPTQHLYERVQQGEVFSPDCLWEFEHK